jgi:hypothetical protein
MAICRYCGQDGATERTLSYWGKSAFFSHEPCRKTGERQEATDCQTIDANCNDCKNYQRKRNLQNTSTGHCVKLNIPVTGSPNKWQGNECFEHRRA